MRPLLRAAARTPRAAARSALFSTQAFEWAVPPPFEPDLAVHGRENVRWPVRRVYCVGRNYAAHAQEMGNNPRDPPFYFAKPAHGAVVDCSEPGSYVPYPPRTKDLHHEVELVVAIGGSTANRGAGGVGVEGALDLVYGYAVGVDLTRRDLQQVAKDARRPWDTAKGFDDSAPVGAIVPVETWAKKNWGHKPMADARIQLRVNGKVRQRASTKDMTWSVAEVVADLSTLFVLEPGDLVFMGTPAGVSRLEKGDTVKAQVGGLPYCEFEMADVLPALDDPMFEQYFEGEEGEDEGR